MHYLEHRFCIHLEIDILHDVSLVVVLGHHFDTFEHFSNFFLVVEVLINRKLTDYQQLLQDIFEANDLMQTFDVHHNSTVAANEVVIVPWPHLKTHRCKVNSFTWVKNSISCHHPLKT